MRFLLFSTIVLHLFVITANAAFLNSSWGARPAGMGNAFTAISDDANALSWNPAGITKCKTKQGTFMFDKPFYGLEEVNLSFSHITYVHPLGFATLGGGIQNFTADQYTENTYFVSFAQDMGRYFPSFAEDVSLGLNLKYLYHKYTLDERTRDDAVFASGNSVGAIGVDFGMLFRPLYTVLKNDLPLSLGLTLKNLNSPDVGLKDTDKVPMETRIGLAYTFPWFISSLDVGSRDKYTTVYFGVESNPFFNSILVRGGANSNEINLGFGYIFLLKDFGIDIDYAFRWPLYIEGSNGSHRVSLSLQFDAPTIKRYEVLKMQKSEKMKMKKARELEMKKKQEKEKEKRMKMKEKQEGYKEQRKMIEEEPEEKEVEEEFEEEEKEEEDFDFSPRNRRIMP
ncbi:MAG: hypothetical protein JW871_06940 [Endomicrobiales bacterium]|nr:hypothetical protein [Endomicrobiales bacterium]